MQLLTVIIPNICILLSVSNIQFDPATTAMLASLENWWISYNLWYKHDIRKCPNYCNATLCHVSRGRTERYVIFSLDLLFNWPFVFTFGLIYFHREQIKIEHFKAGQIRLYVTKQYLLHSLLCVHPRCVTTVFLCRYSLSVWHTCMLIG